MGNMVESFNHPYGPFPGEGFEGTFIAGIKDGSVREGSVWPDSFVRKIDFKLRKEYRSWLEIRKIEEYDSHWIITWSFMHQTMHSGCAGRVGVGSTERRRVNKPLEEKESS